MVLTSPNAMSAASRRFKRSTRSIVPKLSATILSVDGAVLDARDHVGKPRIVGQIGLIQHLGAKLLPFPLALDRDQDALAVFRIEHAIGRDQYWRLSEPTCDLASHNTLALARHDAALLVGADLSGASPVHPFRWPGSVHTKDPAHPVPCRIERINEQAEVHLEEAAEKLSEAVHALGIGSPRGDGQDRTTDQHPAAELSDLASALAAIPVEGMAHVEWIIIGMALHNATDGSDAGLELFDAFSKRSPDYDRKGLEAQWRSFARKPFGKRLRTARSIFYYARQHGWRVSAEDQSSADEPPHDEHATDEKPRADGQQSAGESHTSEAENPDPTMQSEAKTHETADRLPDGMLAPETVLNFFNRKYMLVKDAGKAVIFEPLVDPMLRRRYFDRLRIVGFQGALRQSRRVTRP